jgi:hypothetical protein
VKEDDSGLLLALRAEQAHERAQARAGAPTPHPPAENANLSPGPFQKCHAFFHSGYSAVGTPLEGRKELRALLTPSPRGGERAPR